MTGPDELPHDGKPLAHLIEVSDTEVIVMTRNGKPFATCTGADALAKAHELLAIIDGGLRWEAA